MFLQACFAYIKLSGLSIILNSEAFSFNKKLAQSNPRKRNHDF